MILFFSIICLCRSYFCFISANWADAQRNIISSYIVIIYTEWQNLWLSSGMCNLKGKFLEKHLFFLILVLPWQIHSWQIHFHSLCCCYWVFPTIKKYPYVYQLQFWKPCLWEMAIWDNLLRGPKENTNNALQYDFWSRYISLR